MAKRKSRLKSLRYSHKLKGKGFIMGFPPYNVVEIRNGFAYHHMGIVPTFGVKVVMK